MSRTWKRLGERFSRASASEAMVSLLPALRRSCQTHRENIDKSVFLGLNLDLESGQVLKITPGGQAEALGLRIEDRVVAVQGEALEGKGAFQEALKQKLAKLPRPVQMTFLRIQQVDRAKDSTRREPKEKELDARLQDMQAKLDAALKDTEAAREEAAQSHFV
eukprot:g9104.t1